MADPMYLKHKFNIMKASGHVDASNKQVDIGKVNIKQ